jgi:hypothetical protein
MFTKGKALQTFKKVYLGDAVYLEIDRGQWLLSTNNGIRDIDRIYLDDSIMESLIDHVKSYQTERKEAHDESI